MEEVFLSLFITLFFNFFIIYLFANLFLTKKLFTKKIPFVQNLSKLFIITKIEMLIMLIINKLYRIVVIFIHLFTKNDH